METGRLKWFNSEKGYGFIERENGKDLFVHHSAVSDNQELREGDQLEFVEEQSEKGLCAKNVKIISP